MNTKNTKNPLDSKRMKFYGSTKIGARGQMVIPSEARKDFNITPDTKLLVFGDLDGTRLVVVKAEHVTDYISAAITFLQELEKSS